MSRLSEPIATLDWARWVPREWATLLFVVEAQRVLLIRKKRGLGAGKINAPGGRLELGEPPIRGAIREVREELGVEPVGIVVAGELSFQFLDGYSLHAYVFSATGHRGEPTESDEASPRWTPLDAIPYAEMWADDVLWLPRLLAGESFRGRFVFDGDRLLCHQVDALGAAERAALETLVHRARPGWRRGESEQNVASAKRGGVGG